MFHFLFIYAGRELTRLTSGHLWSNDCSNRVVSATMWRIVSCLNAVFTFRSMDLIEIAFVSAADELYC